MATSKQKIIIDDGMNPELVAGAHFAGTWEIPIIKRPTQFIIPTSITPFSKLKYAKAGSAIGFYEYDREFAAVMRQPEKYVDVFRKNILLSPDCSVYRNAPLAVQLANIYRNRAFGSYYQRQGIYVIPQVRWGSELTYNAGANGERLAFLGIEKHSIVAIGAYGCTRYKDDRYHFQAGLEAMLAELVPEIVLVYGPKSRSLLAAYENKTKFIVYPNWTACQMSKKIF